jgi:hypothetical protein
MLRGIVRTPRASLIHARPCDRPHARQPSYPPAPAWASSVLPKLMPRHTVAVSCGHSEIVRFIPEKSRCELSKTRGRRLL